MKWLMSSSAIRRVRCTRARSYFVPNSPGILLSCSSSLFSVRANSSGRLTMIYSPDLAKEIASTYGRGAVDGLQKIGFVFEDETAG